MTTITINRATVEQALEALYQAKEFTELYDTEHAAAVNERCHENITALRAKLAQQAEPTWVCPDSPEHRYAKPGHCEDCGKTLVQEQGCDHCRHPLYAATKCRACGRVTEQDEPVEGPETVDQRVGSLVESALQAVAEKIGDQCAVWYGIGARDVEEVLREAARYGLVHGTLAEPVEPVAWAFRHSDGTYHDPSVTEHSAGMVPLYTAPPQRKPLTEEEIDALPWNGSPRQFARAVERALEEKNRGR